MKLTKRHPLSLTMGSVFVALAIFTLSACGGSPADSVERVAPTPLSATFAMPTSMITPTPAEAAADAAAQPDATATTAAPVAATTPTPDLARGQTVYVNRKCGDCHGEEGVGIADKGATIAGTTLTLSEFTEILRTGGKGTLGNEHIFGPSAISPAGMSALYAWLQSLPAE